MKRRKQKEREYQEKYSEIPKGYHARLLYLYDKLHLNESICEEIISKIRKEIANIYGTIGTTNFGYFDRVKSGIIAKFDHDKVHVNTFIDDILAAIVAAVCGKIAHQYA